MEDISDGQSPQARPDHRAQREETCHAAGTELFCCVVGFVCNMGGLSFFETLVGWFSKGKPKGILEGSLNKSHTSYLKKGGLYLLTPPLTARIMSHIFIQTLFQLFRPGRRLDDFWWGGVGWSGGGWGGWGGAG